MLIEKNRALRSLTLSCDLPEDCTFFLIFISYAWLFWQTAFINYHP
jgi:hypothetical protein